jgi:hypothetical protein
VDVEARVPPAEDPLGPLRAEQSLVNEKPEHFPDDRPEIAVFPLEARLIFDEEPLEVVKQHPVEDGPLRMARTVDSRHIGKADSKSVPGAIRGGALEAGEASIFSPGPMPRRLAERRRDVV